MSHSHEEIAFRAYHFWEERGRPWGTPETDWFKAQQELSSELPGMLARAAREVGSVLGHAVVFLIDSTTHES